MAEALRVGRRSGRPNARRSPFFLIKLLKGECLTTTKNDRLAVGLGSSQYLLCVVTKSTEINNLQKLYFLFEIHLSQHLT